VWCFLKKKRGHFYIKVFLWAPTIFENSCQTPVSLFGLGKLCACLWVGNGTGLMVVIPSHTKKNPAKKIHSWLVLIKYVIYLFFVVQP